MLSDVSACSPPKYFVSLAPAFTTPRESIYKKDRLSSALHSLSKQTSCTSSYTNFQIIAFDIALLLPYLPKLITAVNIHKRVTSYRVIAISKVVVT